jgi:hypothetical protein
MTADELIRLIKGRPFRPLRLHLNDGRTREILRPEMALVSETSVTIGVLKDSESKVASRLTFCSIPNIVKVEPFDIEKPSTGKGKRPKKRPER